MAGRKPRPEKSPQTLKLSRSVITWLKLQAKRNKKTLSDTVEEIIMEHIRKNERTFEEYASTGRVMGADQEIEFESYGAYFIRGYHARTSDRLSIDPASPYTYYVLHAEDGEYAGEWSDGRDCAFETLKEAFEHMKALSRIIAPTEE